MKRRDLTGPCLAEALRAAEGPWNLSSLAARLAGGRRVPGRSLASQRLVRELLEAQRGAIVQLRNQGEISNDTMRRIGRDLGLGDSGSRSRSDRFALVEGGTGGAVWRVDRCARIRG
jgi:hypothetical protein